MDSITIRNLPEGVKQSLAARAKASGESLEAHLRRVLSEGTGQDINESWSDTIHRLADQARNLPPSDPALFDFSKYVPSREGSSDPLVFDWWEEPSGLHEESDDFSDRD